MGRPTRVFPSKLPEYDLLHTRKVKSMYNTEITALHLIKETEQFHISLTSWAFCCGGFKQLKFGNELKVEIPVITDEKSIEFLHNHAWKDYIQKTLTENKRATEMKETLSLLDRLFPDKKKFFFYELDSLIASFCFGNFISYDDNGKVEVVTEHDIEQREYYVQKYQRSAVTVDTFIDVCKKSIVCPYAFSRPTVVSSEYENAGEIYFVVTPDAVYFQFKRHY